MTSIYFPKQHAAFTSDVIFVNSIRHLEDRIEQLYNCHEILKNLSAIADVYREPYRPAANEATSIEIPEEFAELIGDATSKPLDVRDTIWEIKRKHGTLFVLGFLSPALLTSLESLFTGAVIKYMQMFGADQRLTLEASKVFSSSPENLQAHEEIKDIRNTRYAHKELLNDRHELYFHITDSGEISIDPGAPHRTLEFHPKTYSHLIKCIKATIAYLEKDIEKKSLSLTSKLSKEQKEILLKQWKDAEESGLTRRTIYHTLKWNYIPPSGNN